MNIVEFSCKDCGVTSRDREDPSFTGDWICYHCHCIREGRDPKEALNQMVEMLKTGLLEPASPLPSTAIEFLRAGQLTTPLKKGDRVAIKGTVVGVVEPDQTIKCSFAALGSTAFSMWFPLSDVALVDRSPEEK